VIADLHSSIWDGYHEHKTENNGYSFEDGSSTFTYEFVGLAFHPRLFIAY